MKRKFSKSRDIGDDQITEICSWLLKFDGRVSNLLLWDNRLTSTGSSVLFDFLRNSNSKIEYLQMSHNQLDETCISSLGLYLQCNAYIKRIDLGNDGLGKGRNSLGDDGIIALAPYLDGNLTLRILDIRGLKNITEKSIPAIIDIARKSKIEVIDTDFTSMMSTKYLLVPLLKNMLDNGCEKVEYFAKSITDESLKDIANEIASSKNANLMILNIKYSGLTAKGISDFLDTLSNWEFNNITELQFTSCSIDDGAMASLGDFIRKSSTIKKIYLESNKITDQGIVLLAESMIGNISLKFLEFSFNVHITESSLPNFHQIALNTAVNDIRLAETKIPYEKRKSLLTLLSIPVEQRELPIISNTKSAAKIT